jgi:1-acyl-sn-glycerol-3-phosphate acyltransferase
LARWSAGRAATRSIAVLVVTLGLLPVYIVLYPFGRGARRPVAALWFHVLCRLASLRVRTVGTASAARPTLFAANHISYLDIPVVGVLVDAPFVAKQEVSGWPLIGLIARLGDSVFVRRRPSEVAAQRDEVAQRLAAGQNLFLFAEGTSSDGSGVLPFKPALFAAAHRHAGREVAVQPVSIAYTRWRSGEPLADEERPLYAWFGDDALVPHLWRMIGHEGVEVEVRFHPPVAADAFASRKDLVRHCHAEVSRGLEAAGTGGTAPADTEPVPQFMHQP